MKSDSVSFFSEGGGLYTQTETNCCEVKVSWANPIDTWLNRNDAATLAGSKMVSFTMKANPPPLAEWGNDLMLYPGVMSTDFSSSSWDLNQVSVTNRVSICSSTTTCLMSVLFILCTQWLSFQTHFQKSATIWCSQSSDLMGFNYHWRTED